MKNSFLLETRVEFVSHHRVVRRFEIQHPCVFFDWVCCVCCDFVTFSTGVCHEKERTRRTSSNGIFGPCECFLNFFLYDFGRCVVLVEFRSGGGDLFTNLLYESSVKVETILVVCSSDISSVYIKKKNLYLQ